jgi:hypothetical protein
VAPLPAGFRTTAAALIDGARADQAIAERLADEARLRFGAKIDVPEETE